MKQNTYNTKQKTAIFDCIKEIGEKHFTVDGLCDVLSNKNIQVGRTTIYRCLEKLTNEGILRKFIMPQGESCCYQYVGHNNSCNEHFHLKCEKCGSLIHMECDEMEDLAEHIKSHHGFMLNPLKTVIYGICEGCLEK